MRSLAAILFLACSACALPQYYYRQGYGSYGLGDPYQPQSLRSFRYAQNPIRNQQYQTQNQRYQPQQQSFGRSIGTQNNNNNFGTDMSAYLPVMRALLRVMETDRPSPADVNTLLVETRELNKNVPKGQNILRNFGNFGIDGLESMGLPDRGNIIENIEGVPHIKTTFGSFPLSDTSLMTDAERQQFLPAVRTFTNVLEKGNADTQDVARLLQYSQDLMAMMNNGNSGFDLGSLGNLFGNSGNSGNLANLFANSGNSGSSY